MGIEHFLGISSVLLPPDLNPIEFIWKSIKRHISPLFIETKEMFLETIPGMFYTLCQELKFRRDEGRTMEDKIKKNVEITKKMGWPKDKAREMATI